MGPPHAPLKLERYARTIFVDRIQREDGQDGGNHDFRVKRDASYRSIPAWVVNFVRVAHGGQAK